MVHELGSLKPTRSCSRGLCFFHKIPPVCCISAHDPIGLGCTVHTFNYRTYGPLIKIYFNAKKRNSRPPSFIYFFCKKLLTCNFAGTFTCCPITLSFLFLVSLSPSLLPPLSPLPLPLCLLLAAPASRLLVSRAAWVPLWACGCVGWECCAES